MFQLHLRFDKFQYYTYNVGILRESDYLISKIGTRNYVLKRFRKNVCIQTVFRITAMFEYDFETRKMIMIDYDVFKGNSFFNHSYISGIQGV